MRTISPARGRRGVTSVMVGAPGGDAPSKFVASSTRLSPAGTMSLARTPPAVQVAPGHDCHWLPNAGTLTVESRFVSRMFSVLAVNALRPGLVSRPKSAIGGM
jgi:hypothetical protein